uniref:RNA-directed DNA polymerase n=1 Tax=Trichogramma kaykai TaxID=54128 RepID=A0ABD2X093_9HYME
MDTIKELGFIINTVNDTVTLGDSEIKFNSVSVEEGQLEHRRVQIIENEIERASADKITVWEGIFAMSENTPIRVINTLSQNDKNFGDPYELTVQEIDEKLSTCEVKNEQTIRKLREIILKNRRVFYKKPGRLINFEYELKLKHEKPFFVKPYPVPLNYRDKVRSELKTLLEWEIIRESSSRYVSPLVVVIKKDKSIRLCMDARRLNEQLAEDYVSPCGVEDILQQCYGVTTMSSLDLTSSFYQVALAEDSKKYCAFMFEGKVYEFNVVPFGLKVSSSALIRGLDTAITGMGNHLLNFVDDMLIISRNEEEHLAHVNELLESLDKHNITLKFKKSEFFKKEVEFLGFTLTKEGIRPQSNKIDLIKSFPPPKNVKQLKSFMGVINFYSKFAQNHASLLFPLLKLVKKSVKWGWGDSENQQFEKIKALFAQEVCLAYPDPAKPYYLQTDASNFALGATLSQMNDDNVECPITFISRTLKGAELAYNTTEKELLAVVWSLHKLNTYLRAAEIFIKIDHHALIFMFKSRFAGQRIQRWILSIQDYNLKFEHVKGVHNTVADLLSRYPFYNPGDYDKPGELSIALSKIQRFSKNLSVKLATLASEQRLEPRLKNIVDLLEANDERIKNKFVLQNGLLCKKQANLNKIVIPLSCIEELITETHLAYGHLGSKKLAKLLSERFFIKNMKHRLSQIVASCDLCQVNKHCTRPNVAKQQIILTCKPSELLCIDFLGPLTPSRYGMRNVLVTIDAFSKFVVLYPCRKQTTSFVIKVLKNDYFQHYGKPHVVCCDHGSQFTSKSFKTAMSAENIKLTFSSIRHPSSNGICERVNKTLVTFLRMFIKDKHTAWEPYIKTIQDIMNETHHETTEFTPLELHLNKKPERIWDRLLGVPPINDAIPVERKDQLAYDRIKNKRSRRADKVNEKRGNCDKFLMGDKVLIKCKNSSDQENKILAKFMQIYEGPYIIKSILGENTYLLEDSNSRVKGQFHVNDLIRYRQKVSTNLTPI